MWAQIELDTSIKPVTKHFHSSKGTSSGKSLTFERHKDQGQLPEVIASLVSL